MKTEAHKVYDVFYESDTGFIVMKWNGYATSEQFREGTELMLNLLIKHSAKKVLADAKEMILIGLEDQQWMRTTFLPRAIQFGFRACAIVKPDSYFNKVAIESINLQIDPKSIQVKVFENAKEARDWLQQVEIG